MLDLFRNTRGLVYQLRLLYLIFIVSLAPFGNTANAFEADRGPHYFVSDDINPEQFYWRSPQGFGNTVVHLNLNLLAYLLGDRPMTPRWRSLVEQQPYPFSDSMTLNLQPFASVPARNRTSSAVTGLPMMVNLRRFLNDPLDGAGFNLSLPFSDEKVALSTRSAALRVLTEKVQLGKFLNFQSSEVTLPQAGSDRIWHMAIDFDVTGDTNAAFNVLSPGDGVVESYSTNFSSFQSNIVIRHTAENGKQFLTIYQHMDPRWVPPYIEQGRRVRSGDFLGRIKGDQGEYAHLHFAVAVKGPSGYIGKRFVPKAWYLIDPFGVYDYRRDDTYLPNNSLESMIKSPQHTQVFHSPYLRDSLQ